MNILIETSLDNLYMCIFDKKFNLITKVNLEKIVKKTDVFFDSLKTLLNSGKLGLLDIENIYVTLGPGSFSGSRIGLTFCRTMVQLKNNINLFVAPTYVLFKSQLNNENEIKIKANKYSIFRILGDKISLIPNDGNFHKFDYDRFEKNIKLYISFFKKTNKDELLDIDIIYGSDPQIGELKC